MDRRLNLHVELCSVLKSQNVYYQPPESLTIKYPAIVYELADIKNQHADNSVYKQGHYYSVTLIDTNPESSILDELSNFRTAKFDRHYVADNLYHDTFTIFY